ncbi:peptidase M23 [Acidaminobacter sp. JC074]|uniref:murein hydrolase activator EnvC family protein n=1 Tax=Acidaminobacter sp. JC074 TaxID=2530199 RepID=UPI001F102904|nr:M23 family metallopeptidase [Acidaminobacter sp. JC074]MCH4889571.1 peptidase M23 [Acidaminobacter sp. JC074]
MKKTLLIFFILVFSVSSVYATGDDIEQQEEMLELIEEKLSQLDDSHRDFVNQKNAMIRNIRSLEDSVRNTEDEIEKLNGDIDLNKVEIGKATLELAAAKQALEETTDLMDDRLRIMYMNGTIGYLEVILDSKNFEDLLTRIEMLQRIVESDTALIDQMDRDKQLVDEKKQNLEAEQEKLLALENELQGKRSQLKAQINDLEVQKAALESDIAALEIQIDDTYEDAERVKNIIAELELLQQYVGGEMTWPVPGEFRVTSPFGMRLHPILNVMKLHTGIDIGGNGNTVVAANNGKVIWSNWLSSYGKCIMIDHGGGLVTLYAHNQSLTVKKGDDVTRGQNIAITGSTGNVTGAHLHFEVRKDGEFVDPMEYVKGN